MPPAKTSSDLEASLDRSDVSNDGGRSARSRISEYALLEFLGEGSTAHVYLAEHAATGARVAIKMVDKLLVRRARLEAKVRQEMVLHARLRHPNVLRVLDTFEDARNYYMVLELCEHGSLAAFARSLPDRRLPEPLAKKLFRAAVAGVAYLHAQGVIHRDLKLANLLLTDTDELKISDFGLATRASGEHWTICGTPNFIAPEILRVGSEDFEEGDQAFSYTEAVDIWSLGCILHCLLLGRAPFEGRKVSDTLENVANASSGALSFPRGFSSTAADLIKRLLTSDPTRRPSAQQVLLHPWLRESQRSRSAKLATKRTTRKKPTSAPSQKTPSDSFDQPSDGASSSIPEVDPVPARRSSPSGHRGRPQTAYDGSDDGTDLRIRRKARSKSRSRSRSRKDNTSLYRANVVATDVRSSSGDMDDLSSFNGDDVSADDSGDGSSDVSGVPSSMFAVGSHDEDGESTVKDAVVSASDHVAEEDESGVDGDDTTPPRSGETRDSSLPLVSVVLRFDVRNVPCLTIPFDRSESVEFACREPQEVGGPLEFVLRVSNGLEARYDLSTGSLSATMPTGGSITYCVIPASKSNKTANADQQVASSSYPVLSLARLCQRLAVRAVDLRGSALRHQRFNSAAGINKWPLMVHYDRLPDSILDGTRARAPENVERQLRDELRGPTSERSDGRASRSVTIRGVGTGYIDQVGNLCVLFTDGSRMTLAVSGQQLRFRPPPLRRTNNEGHEEEEEEKEDVFELLTASQSSAFLPTVVTKKLASIPEFIQKLKGQLR